MQRETDRASLEATELNIAAGDYNDVVKVDKLEYLPRHPDWSDLTIYRFSPETAIPNLAVQSLRVT